MGEDEELIGRVGDDTVDAAGGRFMGIAEGRGGGAKHRSAAASDLYPTVAYFSIKKE